MNKELINSKADQGQDCYSFEMTSHKLLWKKFTEKSIQLVCFKLGKNGQLTTDSELQLY